MAKPEAGPEHKHGLKHPFILGLSLVAGIEIVKRLKKGPLFVAYTDTEGRRIFEPISFSSLRGTAEQIIESISIGLHPWTDTSDEHTVTFDETDTEHMRRRPTVVTRRTVEEGPKPKKKTEDIYDPDEKTVRESSSLFPEGLPEFLERVDRILEE